MVERVAITNDQDTENRKMRRIESLGKEERSSVGLWDCLGVSHGIYMHNVKKRTSQNMSRVWIVRRAAANLREWSISGLLSIDKDFKPETSRGQRGCASQSRKHTEARIRRSSDSSRMCEGEGWMERDS